MNHPIVGMDSRKSSQFRIPISFPSASCLGLKGNPVTKSQDILAASLTKSQPTVLEHLTWSESHVGDCAGRGIVFGCEDGTLYIMYCPTVASSNTTTRRDPEINEPTGPKNSTRNSRSSRNTSRNTSPTVSSFALSPTFNVTAKPRVVSGVTAEQVEAPKNYVDFDDEPDKLKDILKGRNPRDRSAASTFSDSGSDRPKSSASSIIEPVPPAKRKNIAPRSLLSAANSRAPTPPPFSSPQSPNDSTTHSPTQSSEVWRLRYHTIPLRSGFGHAIKSIRLLSDDQFIATLQESGDIHIYSSIDGCCKVSLHVDDGLHLDGKNEHLRPRDIWTWRNLTVSYVGETVVLIAIAANEGDTSAFNSDAEDGSSETSRCVAFEFSLTSSSVQLTRLGQWEVDGPALADGIHTEVDGTMSFFSTSHDGHFIIRKFQRPSSLLPLLKPVVTTENGGKHTHGLHLSTLAIPHGIKHIMARSTEHLNATDPAKEEPVSDTTSMLSEQHDVGILIEEASLCGMKTHHLGNGRLQGLAWNHDTIAMFEYAGHSMTSLFRCPADGVRDVFWLDDGVYAQCFEDRVDIYRTKIVNANNEDIQDFDLDTLVQPDLIQSINIGFYDNVKCIPGSVIISRLQENTRRREILTYPITHNDLTPSAPVLSKLLWQSSDVDLAESQVTLTAMLPLELETIIQGYSDGYLRQFSLAQIARKGEAPTLSTSSSIKTSKPPVDGFLVGLHVVHNPRTREKYVVGGADDGSIAFWSLSTFELVARWIIFTAPLSKVLQFESDTTGPLRGCALCVSRDGAVAIVVIDGFHFLYLLPGSSAPLARICLGGNNLMLIYSDHRARLWDAQTKELWRSMGQDKAEELMAEGGWAELLLERDACVPKTAWSSVADSFDGKDAAATLTLNLEQLVIDSISVTKAISTSRDEVREVLLTLDRLRLILSSLLTPGLNNDVDSICYGKLGAHPSSTAIGLTNEHSTTLYETACPQDVWSISETVTATRALAIISVLRAMSLFEELTEGANIVIAFYSVSLGPCVGSRFKNPSLEYLGKLWFEASNELRASIRTIFDATIASLSDENAIKITEKWQHHVPSLQPDAEKETLNAALALLICGSIASEKYSLLSINALTDISKSISLYLHDEKSIYRTLAIDLCSRGFHVWQHYIDSMEILRSLFNLATNVRKESISIQNVGVQARSSVLSIASNNMPLLMGTICLDILNPPTMEHRRSVLQILAFLIRKRPYVLQPNLPRLMEAVVKSLDPNSTANRELVLDAATEIIGYVVKTYPTVDFHMSTQRLAVGTNEGALVMYDLKTAIRLYVLEGHKKPITSASFSPDGRRLVTVCLKESLVLVWKVGSSFASFFNPGAPPRQGHGGSEPFKTLNFNVGTEADMTTAETLELVRVEWIADRSVKVRIQQSVLTFST